MPKLSGLSENKIVLTTFCSSIVYKNCNLLI